MQFDKAGIYPEAVPLNVLSRALSALQRLALGEEAHGDDDDEESLPPESFGLLHVKRGSAIYQIATRFADVAISRLTETGSVIANPESIGERDFILSPLEELSAVSKALACPIVIRRPGRDGEVLATIMPTSFGDVSKGLFVKGETTLFGRVERVGGATSVKCGLRLPNRTRMLHCHVESNDVARDLGQKLYQNVSAKGTAHWMKTNWKVVRFSIRQIRQPKLKPFSEMIDSLRNAGGSDWDHIKDPEAFLGG